MYKNVSKGMYCSVFKYTEGNIELTLRSWSLTSQKNSFPRKPQNHEIQDTSSELLIFLRQKKPRGEFRY